MTRTSASVLIASALVAGCTVTSTPAADGGTGTDAAGSPDTDSNDSGASPDVVSSTDAATADVVTGDVGTGDAATAGGCAFGEPNDTRDTATPVDVNRPYTGLCLSNADGTTDQSDFYVMTAPSDVPGGYVTFTVSNVGTTGTIEVLATAVADGVQMVEVVGKSAGANVTGWFTVSPGAQYRLELKRYPASGMTFDYDLLLAYTKASDAYEPNNTRADAKTIALTTPIQASAMAVSANGTLATDDDSDWYKVTLAAGSVAVKLTNSPANYQCNLRLFDSSNAAVVNAVFGGPGADCELDATNITAGDYTLDVNSYLPIDRAGGDAPPPSITADYTLAVTQ